MSEENKETNLKENEVPEWLKVIQLNSWEAELLISALLLYMLFQVPEFIDNYRNQHYDDGYISVIFKVFITALKVLRIGYSIHIIARGIWVASVGLSYIFPKSLNIDRLKFKGKFKKELENDVALDKTIKNLEKVASLSYAISFMISGMVISAGLVFIYLMIISQGLLTPAIRSGISAYMVLSMIAMLFFVIIILIVFVDFITNGFFRRDQSISKPYYYIAMIFRYMTLSFIYNRINLTIISNLKRWQAHLVPVLAVSLIGGYMYLESKVDDWDEENYLETSFNSISRMNYENLRKKDDPLFATIQNDVIDNNVIRLFVRTHGTLSRFYSKDSTSKKGERWSELSNEKQSVYADRFVNVSIDGVRYKNLDWNDYKHPVSYEIGFLNYIDISKMSNGSHNLTVEFDTAVMNDLQLKVLMDKDPPLVKLASIDFFKAE